MNTWRCTHSIEIAASPAAIWKLFRNVEGWQRWNAGIERIEMLGPFAAGTTFLMTPPGQPTLSSQLVEVIENNAFIDRTVVGDLVVVVAHEIKPVDSQVTRVEYTLEASGPDCEVIGAAIASDFPDVLKALGALATA